MLWSRFVLGMMVPVGQGFGEDREVVVLGVGVVGAVGVLAVVARSVVVLAVVARSVVARSVVARSVVARSVVMVGTVVRVTRGLGTLVSVAVMVGTVVRVTRVLGTLVSVAVVVGTVVRVTRVLETLVSVAVVVGTVVRVWRVGVRLGVGTVDVARLLVVTLVGTQQHVQTDQRKARARRRPDGQEQNGEEALARTTHKVMIPGARESCQEVSGTETGRNLPARDLRARGITRSLGWRSWPRRSPPLPTADIG